MHETIQKMARAFAKQREQRRRAFAGFTALAILVSISTTYLLVRPANTMAVDYYCGYEAHIHTEECFERVLICGYETEDNTVSGGGGVEWLPPEFDLPEVTPPAEGEIPVEGELPEVLPPAEGEIPVEGELPEVIPPVEGEIPVEGELPEVTPPAEEPPVVEVPEVKEPETAETPAEPDVPAVEETPVEETPAEEPEEEPEVPAESETLTASSIQYDEAPADSGSSEDSAPADSGSDEPAPAPKEESKPAEAPKAEEPKEEPKAEEPSAPAETPSEEPEAPAGSEEPAEGEDPAEEPTEGEPSVEGEEPEIPSDESSEPEGHVHTEECYEYILICELPEHIHTELCLPQSMVQLLPEGAELPEGYDNEYSFVDTDDGFAVVVYAPDGALPEDVELVAELLEEGSDAYITAAQALEAMAEETVPVYIGGVMPESALEEAAAAADPDVEYIEEPEIFEEELTQPEEPAAPVEGEIFGEIPADPRVTEPEAPAEESAEPEVPAEPPVEEPAEEPAEEPEAEEPAEGETLTASSIQYDEIPAEEPVIEEDIPAEEPVVEEEIPAEEPVVEEEIPAEEPVVEEEILAEEPVIEEELSAEEPTPEEIFGEDFIPYRDEVADEGFLALDIRFELYGEEVEPVMPVFVCINVKALLPENVDPASVVIVHLKEEGEEEISAEEDDMVSLMGEISEGESAELGVSGPVVEVVADSTEDTGILETVSSEDYTALDVNSFFAVDSFSTFTIKWGNATGPALEVICIDTDGNEIGRSTTTTITGETAITSIDPTFKGCSYKYATIAGEGENPVNATKITSIRYNNNNNVWEYRSDRGQWTSVGEKTIYLVYNATLHPVDTVDNTSKGLYMYMFDYNNHRNDFHGDGEYKDGTTKEGMASATTQGSGAWHEKFPQFRKSNGSWGSLAAYFSPTNAGDKVTSIKQANYLFLADAYEDGGWFEYSAFENFAEFDKNTGEFTVYKELGTPSGNSNYYYKRGNFMPYNTLKVSQVRNHNLYDSLGVALSESDDRYNEDIYAFNEGNNFFFGMYAYAQFYQPKDGKVDGDEMIFEFTGDDDMWVYIDGVLVLDLGGIHDAQSGSINFTTGEVKWSDTATNKAPTWKSTTIKKQFEAAKKENSVVWDNERTNTFVDGGLHTIQIFYMERGEGASNLKMRLNLPTIPEGSLMVRKDVEDYYNEQMKDLEYTFVVKVDNEVMKGAEYYIYPNEDVKLYTDATTGYFKLKHNQTAVFEAVEGGTTINVTEVAVEPEPGETGRIDQVYDITYSATDANGQPVPGGSATMPAAGSVSVVVTNRAKFTKPLTITKSFTIDGEKNAAVPTGFAANFWLYELDEGGAWVKVGGENAEPVPFSALKNGSYTYLLEQGKSYAVVEEILNEGSTGKAEIIYSTTAVTTDDEDTVPPAKPAKPAGIAGAALLAAGTAETGDTISFENIYGVPTGDIAINKNVKINGETVDSDEVFTFKLTSTNEIDGTYEIYIDDVKQDNTVTFSKGTATVSVTAGTTVEIRDLPINAKVSVQEIGYEGYAPSWNVNGGSEIHSDLGEVTVGEKLVTIYFTNVTGAALPSTGGIGTHIYTTFGIVMMLGAGVLLLNQRRRKEAVSVK